MKYWEDEETTVMPRRGDSDEPDLWDNIDEDPDEDPDDDEEEEEDAYANLDDEDGTGPCLEEYDAEAFGDDDGDDDFDEDGYEGGNPLDDYDHDEWN